MVGEKRQESRRAVPLSPTRRIANNRKCDNADLNPTFRPPQIRRPLHSVPPASALRTAGSCLSYRRFPAGSFCLSYPANQRASFRLAYRHPPAASPCLTVRSSSTSSLHPASSNFAIHAAHSRTTPPPILRISPNIQPRPRIRIPRRHKPQRIRVPVNHRMMNQPILAHNLMRIAPVHKVLLDLRPPRMTANQAIIPRVPDKFR